MTNDLLRQLPSVSQMLSTPLAEGWLGEHPRTLVTSCIREALEDLRRAILADNLGRCGTAHISADAVLQQAGQILARRTSFNIRAAINATGVILHTGLGRAVLPQCVVDSMSADLGSYVTLAVDRQSGLRSERDERVEGILTELTGGEAATVVNNNAAATLLVLAALGAGRETIVSRGQLIEIGGSFRLPEVMAASGTRMVEVGATNRTHLRDYERTITPESAIIFRAHPSNFRVVGFASSVDIADLASLAHARGLVCVDDLGAGALVDLAEFGLPHEPTVQESLAAGADIVLFSADKLIGASQGGVIVGRRDLIDRIRKHPLWRALRVDKTMLMALERTLHLFRDPRNLRKQHPLYRMLSATAQQLEARAAQLADLIKAAAPAISLEVKPSAGYLGSGSLPDQKLPSFALHISGPLKAQELAERLRMDEAAVFGRLESDAVVLDVLTLEDSQLQAVAGAVARCI